MATSNPRVTFRDIAREAGVSVASVTHAFRGNHHVSPAKRDQILETAERLGYKPHPLVAALMSEVRRNRVAEEQSVLAMVDYFSGSALMRKTSRRMIFEGARDRAEDLGHKLDLFEPIEQGLTARRLHQILYARNVTGLILPPLPTEPELPEGFPWEKFCVVTAGFTSRTPAFHSVLADHFAGVTLALDQLTSRGYQKIGLYISDFIDQRVRRVWSSAYFRWAIESLENPKAFTRLYTGAPYQENFVEWVRNVQPDAVIVDFFVQPQILAEERAGTPDGLGIATLINHAHDGENRPSGIDQNYRQIGAASVDLLTAHLYRNEIGIPGFPKKVLIAPSWVEGRTMRPPESPQ